MGENGSRAKDEWTTTFIFLSEIHGNEYKLQKRVRSIFITEFFSFFSQARRLRSQSKIVSLRLFNSLVTANFHLEGMRKIVSTINKVFI